VAFVDDGHVARRRQPLRHLLDRLLRRRQADPMQRLLADLLQTLQCQRQVRAAAGADDGVDLVDDYRARGAQHLPAPLGGEQEVERLGGGHQDVRRGAEHRRALGLGGVAGAHRRGDPRRIEPHLLGDAPDALARLGEVLVDVGAQRLERRDVDHAHFVRRRLTEQIVERDEKRRQGLARAGRRGDERVPAVANRRPSLILRGSRRAEGVREPRADDGMEVIEGHGDDNYRWDRRWRGVG